MLSAYPITSSVLASSTVAEPSAGEAVWNAATSYAEGNVVIRTTTHRKYECQIAGADSTIPENAPTRWLDIGPTNKWAMFDQNRNAQTVATTSMQVELTPCENGSYGTVGGSFDSSGTEIVPTAGTNPANSVIGNSFITWLATGTRLGPISA